MSPIGHTVTTVAMATTTIRICNISWDASFSSLTTLIMSGNLANMDQGVFIILVALGMLLGARGPDRLEIPRFNRRTKTRLSLIPHRTLTHWPPFWVAMTATFWLALGANQEALPYMISGVGLGFCAAGWLHLVMDIMTPMGIPLITPFGPRTSFNFYRTAKKGELLCIVLFVAGSQLICEIS